MTQPSRAAAGAHIAAANRQESEEEKPPTANREASEEKRTPTGRKARIPLGTHRAKLVFPGFVVPPDKVARVVVDHPGRLARAEEGGYTFVEDPNVKVGQDPENQRDRLSTKVSVVVGKTDDGAPLRGYLMIINKDWYEEDQRTKQAEIDETDEAIRTGGIAGRVGEDNRYIPDSGIIYNP